MNKNLWFIAGQISEKEWEIGSPAYPTKKKAQDVMKTMRKDLKYRIVKYTREA